MTSMTNPIKRYISTLGNASFAVFLILFGCCANVLTLEVLTSRDPGIGGLVTFAQFAFIALQSSTSQIELDTKQLYQVVSGSLSIKQLQIFKKPEIPFKLYVKITAVFFLASILNNKALDFGISIPVHTVFRSSGLTATLLMGKFAYGIHYTINQIVACTLVTLGILAVTLADAYKPQLSGCCGDKSMDLLNSSVNSSTQFSHSLNQSVSHFANESTTQSLSQSELDALSVTMNWTTGISMMFVGLFLLAYLGHKQDQAYKVYGKHTWREVMFYTHLLSLPVFALAWRDMIHHSYVLVHGEPTVLTITDTFHLDVPLWMILVLNLAFQTVCIRGVYMLTTYTNALTLNLTITFRKLMSLLLSVHYFGNVFTSYHWAASSLVFAGVLVYSLDASKPTVNTAKRDENIDSDEQPKKMINNVGSNADGLRQRQQNSK